MYQVVDTETFTMGKLETAFVTLKLVPAMLNLPGIWRLFWSLLPGSAESTKTWRRIFRDATFRYMFNALSFRQVVAVVNWRSSLEAYRDWVNANPNAEGTEIEDIPNGNGSQIFWIGKKEDMKGVKVLYHFHGGGFFLALEDASMVFSDDIAKSIEKSSPGVKIAVAILNYTLLPNVQLPSPLQEAVAGLHHILSLGVNPEDIQILGDSAGGNLVLQLLLHCAHPFQGSGISPLNLGGRKLVGAYMMSPWIVMTPRKASPSWSAYDGIDTVTAAGFAEFGYQVLMSAVKTPGLLPYVDQTYRPEGWYEGLEGVVERIAVSAGGNECIRDDIVEIAEAIKEVHPRTTLLVDARGVHDEPLADYSAGESRVGELTPIIKEWFKEGYSAKH